MTSRNLSFDITTAADARGLLETATAARGLGRELDRLDGRRARVRVDLDAASQAPIQDLTRQLDSIDRRTARARVDLDGAEQAETRGRAVQAVLDRLPERVRTRIEVELDGRAAERITAITAGVSRLGDVSRRASAGVVALHVAAKGIVDPASIPAVERLAATIGTHFRAAVERAGVGVDRLGDGLRGLRTTLLGVGAAGNAAGALTALSGALGQLSGIALLAPAAIGAVGAAYATAKLATVGFSDALTGSAKKQREAYAAMGPEARRLVDSLKEMGPAANAFRQAIQDTTVKGLADQIRPLADTYLPMLKIGLSGVASGFNGMALGAVRAVQSSQAVAAVRTIVDATAQATGRMRDAAGNAALGFLTLGAAGARHIPSIGTAIDNAAAKFRAWSTAVTRSGQFDQWVERAKTNFAQLGTILGDVGAIFGQVFRALDTSGGGALSTLAAVTTQTRVFLQTAEGSGALQGLADVVIACGDALSDVLAAGLRTVAPLIRTLAPLAQRLAQEFGEHLVRALELAGPVLQRLAQAMADNPEMMLALAKAAAAVTIGFGPMVAIIGVAATLLKGLVLARVAGLALSALGLAGTAAGTALMFLASPLTALRTALPLIARGAGSLVASLLLATGPVGALVLAFGALYVSSEQFRGAVATVSATVGGLFVAALQQAGRVIASTVELIGETAAAVGGALSSLTSLGSSLAGVFGPAGQAVSATLSAIFESLGSLPGAALAAFAAFRVLGTVTPLFTAASAAAAGFSARLLAFSSASTVATVAANATGAAAGRIATALTRVGSALPVIGVALIGLGYVFEELGDQSDQLAEKVITSQLSMSAAIQASAEQLQRSSDYWQPLAGLTSGAAEQQEIFAVASGRVTAELEKQLAAMGPLERLAAEVTIAQNALNEAVDEFGATSPQATAASAALVQAQDRLAAAQREAEAATKSHTDAVRDQVDVQFEAANAALAYESSLRRLEDAQSAAAAAEKEHGKTSREYKEASDDVVRATLDVAAAAGKRAQAEAEAAGRADAAAVGTQAQTQTLLSLAATASGPARDALLKVAQGMNQAELDALSAANAASGLKTQILTLPNGKRITVLVDPTQAVTGFEAVQRAAAAAPKDLQIRVEAPTAQVQQQLRDIGVTVTQIPGTKDVSLQVEDAAGRAKLDAFLATINVASAAPKIDLVTATAEQKATGFVAYVDGLVGVATADADTTPGTGKAAQMKADIDAITAIMKADADISPGTAKGAELQSHISSLIGIMTADANNAPGTAKGDALRSYISNLIGIMEARANTDPATEQGRAAKAYIDGLRAMLQADANTGPARDALGRLYAEWHGKTINVNIGGSRITGSGGAVVGYAGGGVVGSPHRFAAGGVIGGYRPGVDDVPAMLSRGEAVLVPELVRQIGVANILRANAAASGGRPATVVGNVPPSLAKGGGVPVQTMIRGAAAGGGGAAMAAAVGSLRGELVALRSQMAAVGDAVRAARPITVEDHSGNPVETAHATRLALRM